MKKEEALILAEEKSKLVIEYIMQILSDTEKVNGVINFNSAKIDNQKMCTLDIYVPEREKHLNIGITTDHVDVFYAKLLTDFLDVFLEHETMGISKYYSIKGMNQTFCGMNAVNSIGSQIKLNFLCQGSKFSELMTNYNQRINEYVNSINENKHNISRK